MYNKKPLVKTAMSKRGPFTLSKAPTKQSNDEKVEEKPKIANKPAHTFNFKEQAVKDNSKKVETAAAVTKEMSLVERNKQREVYRHHRERLANVKGKVNSCLPPPKIKVVESGNRMELPYMEMLAALYRKSNNDTRTFTKSPDPLAAGRWRHANLARNKERKQLQMNEKFYKGGELFDAKLSNQENVDAAKGFSYEVPLHVLLRYEKLMSKCDVDSLCSMLRPQIYFDLEVRGTSIKGRFSIQLFTEACPEVVLHFIRICTDRQMQRISFNRTYSAIWMEAHILLDKQRSLDTGAMEHDFEVLNHGVDAGILSFPSRYVRGNMLDTFNFTISFKPLSIMNGKRIAFGKIRKGLQLLHKIQDATGHMTKAHNVVLLTDCGIL